jgi:hypothetical protein
MSDSIFSRYLSEAAMKQILISLVLQSKGHRIAIPYEIWGGGRYDTEYGLKAMVMPTNGDLVLTLMDDTPPLEIERPSKNLCLIEPQQPQECL